MKHEKTTVSKAGSLLGKQGAGKPKQITEQDRERRREHMRKVSRERWARIKAEAKLLLVAAVLGVTATSALGIPSGVLRAQEHLAVDIKWDVLNNGACCQAVAQFPACKPVCDKIAAKIRDYIAGLQANIAQLNSALANVSDPKERAEIQQSIAGNQKDIDWAKAQLKAVAQ